MTNSYLRKKNADAMRPRRSYDELMSLLDVQKMKSGEMYKQVSFEEAHDLWCRKQTLLFNTYNSVNTFWQPYRLSLGMLQREDKLRNTELSKIRFRDIINIFVKPSLPKASDDIFFFVVIPVAAKRAPHNSSLAV